MTERNNQVTKDGKKRKFFKNKRHHKRSNKSTNNRGYLNDLKKQYQKLFENYSNLKSKYFEVFYSRDFQRKKSIEVKYFSALEKLNEFKVKLKDWQYEKVVNYGISYPEDKVYSKNRGFEDNENDNQDEIDSTNLKSDDLNTDKQYEDPHILPSQISRESFIDDEEESIADKEWIVNNFSNE